MRLLRREGIEAIFPQNQTCCGQPAYNSGYRDAARQVARLQLEAFSEDLPIVVPSASCAAMLKVHYPMLFDGTPEADRAAALAARVVELSVFLLHVLDWHPLDLGPPLTVAVHNSCSSRREMGSAGATMGLLGRLANLTLVEPERANECCGFGGAFALKQPEISAAMAGDKAASIVATSAPVLVGQDAGCLMNLGGIFARQCAGPRVVQLAEFLWERTHGPC